MVLSPWMVIACSAAAIGVVDRGEMSRKKKKKKREGEDFLGGLSVEHRTDCEKYRGERVLFKS